MSTVLLANASAVHDPTDPPLSVAPAGALSVLPAYHNETTDQTAPAGPGLGANAGQNGIIRIDQTVGGTTTARNIITWATGLRARPPAFARENWQGQPMPLNRLQGRVGYQANSDELRTRLDAASAITVPTGAEGAAAALNPAIMATLDVRRGRRFA